MRIFNRTHVPWFIFVILATIAASWLYVGNFYPDRLPSKFALPAALVQKSSQHRSVGGTPLGLIFGAISFAIFIFATLFGLRKKVVLLRLGTVQQWMRAHIWLTLLTIPLVLLHSGFRLGGAMTILLMVLYAIVMVSGIYGLILQHRVPQVMKERLPVETVFEQIPYVRARIYAAAEKMRASLALAGISRSITSAAGEIGDFKTEAKTLTTPTITASAIESATSTTAEPESEVVLVDFLDRQVLPYLRAKRGRNFRLGDAGFSDDTFRFLKLNVAQSYRPLVEEIQAWCDERRLLDLQVKLQNWLHAWLLVHVPISFLLVILTAWHAFATLFYY